MTLVRRVQEEVLERIGRVGVAARHAVESVLQGQHRSINRGLSVEFAGHRPYIPGDDLRHLDWQVWARTDRYDVRVYEEETRLRATLVVDYSGSMGYERAGAAVSKCDYARMLAAALAFLMIRQGDAVGLALVDHRLREHLPYGGTMGHLLNLLGRLEDQEAGGETHLGSVLEVLAERLDRRGLVILISDVFDDLESFTRALHHLRHRRQDIRVFQVLDRDEDLFPFRGTNEFVGLEGEAPLRLDADRIRSGYREVMTGHARQVETACHALGVAYSRCTTADDLAMSLVEALTAHGRMAGVRR